jgi:thiol-disulfide isomerase/thioredoxin
MQYPGVPDMIRQLLLLALLLVPAVALADDEPAPKAKAEKSDMPTLSIGDKAPPLAIAEWVKGEPVKEFEKDKIYVLDFWASWCEPCVASIPELNKLQLDNADKNVVVIGVNCMEADETDVAAFVKKQGKKMSYRVATDDLNKSEDGRMVDTWLTPAGQEFMPTVFVVNGDGLIAWIGHPAQLPEVLAQVVEKKWDLTKAKEEFVNRAKQAKELFALQEKLHAAIEEKRVDDALKVVDEMLKLEPAAASKAGLTKFLLLLRMDEYEKAYAMNDELFKLYNNDSETLNEISWTIMDDEDIAKRDYPMSMKFAVRANEVAKGEDPAILDTLARAHHDKGELDKAIEFQKKAIEKAGDDKKLKKELEKTLKKYRTKQAV